MRRRSQLYWDAPLFDLDPHIVETKTCSFRHSSRNPRIETLDLCALDRLARFDELHPYTMLVGQASEIHKSVRSQPMRQRVAIVRQSWRLPAPPPPPPIPSF